MINKIKKALISLFKTIAKLNIYKSIFTPILAAFLLNLEFFGADLFLYLYLSIYFF